MLSWRFRLLVPIFILNHLVPPAAISAERAALKVGLALSGGGARGAAHIGVLKVLEREGIPIDCIAGTSFGALVGGLYALGYKADEIEQIFAKEDWAAIFSNASDLSQAPLHARARARYQGELNFKGFIPVLPTGLLAGQRLIEILDVLTTDRMIAADFDFDRLAIPFRAVATNLVDGNRYVFHTGPMTEAIRASVAAPAFITPIEKDQMLLGDGGLVDNLPTDVVREMGADIVIAVDVTSPLLEKEQIRTFVDVLDQSISLAMRRDVETNLKLADLVLRPDLEHFSALDYARIQEIEQLGVKEAEGKLDAIKALLSEVYPHAPQPVPVLPASPTVASVSFEGLKAIPARQLRSKVKARAGQPLDVKVLAEDLRRLYATALFDQADYRLTPAGDNSYNLIFALRESPMHSLGASIRYDLDYGLVALGEISARQVFHTPSIITISSQFGGLDHDFASMHYIPSRLPFLYIAPEVHLDKREYFDIRDEMLVDKFTDRKVGGELMIGTTFKQSEIELGYQVDRVTIAGGTAPNRQDGVLRLRGIRLNVTRDTLDAQDFPTNGTVFSARADQRLKMLGSDLNFSRYEADFNRYLPISQTSTIQLYAAAGHARGSIPFYERFYIGGFNFSEGAPRRMAGFDFDELPAHQMGIIAASYRYRWLSRPLGFAKRAFVTGYYNAAALSDEARSPYDFNLYQGVGAELSVETMIGPLRLAAGWGQGSRFNLYFTFGPSF